MTETAKPMKLQKEFKKKFGPRPTHRGPRTMPLHKEDVLAREWDLRLQGWQAALSSAGVRELREALEEVAPLVEFYSEREMNAPANNQEAVRETRERLRRFRAVLARVKEAKDAR